MREIELRHEFNRKMKTLLGGLELESAKDIPRTVRNKQPYPADKIITVKAGNNRKKLLIQFIKNAYPRDLEYHINTFKQLESSGDNPLPVLVVPFLSETGRGLLRDRGFNYIDLSGNVYIAFDDVLIYKEAAENAYQQVKDGINIFSDKASLVIRELIAHPEKFLTVRGIAEKTGASVGWTSEVLNDLEDRGYLQRKPHTGCRIQRIESLLDDWTNAYRFPGKNKVRHCFVKAETLEEILGMLKILRIPEKINYALTVHAGARLVSPFAEYNECHLYVDNKSDFQSQVEFFTDSLRLIEPVAGGNFHIAAPYYKTGAFYRIQERAGLKVVSDLQLYLDLIHFPARGREQAEKVLEQSGLPDLENW
ncbi:MAG: hypothetical protein JW738_03635 [Actinobacteria bacterium]|nr:hypothetical protein [Actinomycetota bacterium]